MYEILIKEELQKDVTDLLDYLPLTPEQKFDLESVTSDMIKNLNKGYKTQVI